MNIQQLIDALSKFAEKDLEVVVELRDNRQWVLDEWPDEPHWLLHPVQNVSVLSDGENGHSHLSLSIEALP
jgi:hypothetical protein